MTSFAPGLLRLERATVLTDPVVDGRTIFGLCVPYNRPTIVADEPGKFYREQFARGSFRGAVKSPHRVGIRLSHSPDEIVRSGTAHGFEDRPDGLYGEFVADMTPAGDALVAMARSEDPVGLSIGAVALDNKTEHGIITRTRCHLDHVAAVKSPAYKDARVLALRSTDPDDTLTLTNLLAKWGHLLHSESGRTSR